MDVDRAGGTTVEYQKTNAPVVLLMTFTHRPTTLPPAPIHLGDLGGTLVYMVGREAGSCPQVPPVGALPTLM
jgi:hypothetical protein